MAIDDNSWLSLAGPEDDGDPAEGAPDAPLRRLLERALRGSSDARNELFAAVAPRVVAVVRSTLAPGGTSDVEDVAQEALIRLNRALPNYRGECSVMYFATRVAVNTTTDFLRRKIARRKYEAAAAPRQDDLQEMPRPGESLAHRSRLRFLLETLSEAQAETLLYVALGHSVQEIAQVMSVPTETVRSRLRLARRAVRLKIESDPASKELFGGEHE